MDLPWMVPMLYPCCVKYNPTGAHAMVVHAHWRMNGNAILFCSGILTVERVRERKGKAEYPFALKIADCNYKGHTPFLL